MSQFELAQLNIAHLLAPLDSPQLRDFVANLDRINTLAEASPGFVWRLQTDDGNATAVRPFGEEIIVNLSVWSNVDALKDFVYKSAHLEIMRRRKEWFEQVSTVSMVLWWVKAGHQPDVEEACQKLKLLQSNGPTPEAFTFRKSWETSEAKN